VQQILAVTSSAPERQPFIPNSRLLDKLLAKNRTPDSVIVDEAHHYIANSYKETLVRLGAFDSSGSYLLGHRDP
jgi:superfamily II DNA or RNA helicase